MITDETLQRLRTVAGLLLPGDAEAPAATDLADLAEWLTRSLVAVGSEAEFVTQALDALPPRLTWESLEELDRLRPELFEPLSAVVAGAYFMSPQALDAIGYPHGPRKAASVEQIVNELETGILEPVLNRPAMLRKVP